MAETMYDYGKLSNEELANIGVDPRVFQQHNDVAKQKCTECKKHAPTPTTRYTLKGIDIIKGGESLCSKCLNKRISTYQTLIQMVQNGKIKLGDL